MNNSLSPMPRVIAPFDIVVLVLMLAAGAASVPLLSRHTPSTVAIYRDNTLLARYPLHAHSEVTVQGAVGSVTVTIDNAGVRVSASSCSNHICVASGSVGTPGRQVVCAPNHIIVSIEGRAAEEPDAIVQ